MLRSSVGRAGANDPADVRQVQQLLNDNRAAPPVRVDGVCGRQTEEALVRFQARVVGLRSPDALVSPNGPTWRALHRRAGGVPAATAPRPHAASPEERREFRAERARFVDARVKELPVTTRIIDDLLPHFRGTSTRVISAWLSDSDLHWKVNYHWEYLLWMVDHLLNSGEGAAVREDLRRMQSALLAVAPSPSTGYRTGPVGTPEDRSSGDAMTQRHAVLSQQKRAFADAVRVHDLASRSRRPRTAFDLAAAPVAHPGKTKHSAGHAVDLQGPNGEIKSVSRRLGATLVFDERSHVHVEFRNGVTG